MLHADKEEACNDPDYWTLAHVVSESTHPMTKERTLKLRFKDGVEEDVYAGAMHRPSMALRRHRRHNRPLGSGDGDQSPCPSTDPPDSRQPDETSAHVVADYHRRGISPPPPRDGHASSVNEMSEDDSQVITDSKSEVTETEVRPSSPSTQIRQVRSSAAQ
jgi:hypothetical protein